MNDFRERMKRATETRDATATRHAWEGRPRTAAPRRPALDARTKARAFEGAALTIGTAILAAVAAVAIGGLVADQLATITAALQAATAR